MASPRRSVRERQSRLIYVKGQPVLKLNNYSLLEGEHSVWRVPEDESELLTPPLPKKMKKNCRDSKVNSENGKTKLVSAWSVRNAKLDRDCQVARAKSMVFMANILPELEPFITPSVIAKIKKESEKSPFKRIQPKVEILRQPKCIQNGEMRSYQLEGMSFLLTMFDNGVSAILADEMGLGKTLQTIAFLAYLKFERHVEGPHLVVCPLSVLSSWLGEFKRWCPAMRVIRCHSADKDERQRLRRELWGNDEFDVVVTTYETLKSENMKNIFQSRIRWRYLVLDEGHRVKNEQTIIANVIRRISRQNLLLLTGTPLQNNLHELWSLFSQLYTEIFTDVKIFDNIYSFSEKIVDFNNLEKVHILLKKLCLRRLKIDVEKNLPPKTELKLFCPLSKMQHFWYKRILLKNSKILAKLEAEAGGLFPKTKDAADWKKLQNLLMQLRKCSNHPYLFPGANPDPDVIGEELVTSSGKMQLLDRLLQKLKAGGHRVVIFSQFTMMLDLIEDYCVLRNFDYRRLDGSVNRVQRTIDIQMFNKPSSPIFAYLLSTRAGGLGVNLQTADTAIIFDSDWNPQVDLQAMARVHRIGQTKPVCVYRFVSAGTVEERMQLRCEKKLFLDLAVNEGGVNPSKSIESAHMSELLSTISFGAKAFVSSDDIKELTDEDLDRIIDRTSTTTDTEIGKQECSIVQESEPTAIFGGFTSICIFEGEDYSQLSLKDIRTEWMATTKRKRLTTTINVDGYNVKRKNLYDIETGEPSVFDREYSGKFEDFKEPLKNKRQRAGIDYEHEDECLVCHDGGLLVCCDKCPAAYHLECLGLTEKILPSFSWICPHHSCGICRRNACAAGGLLFRCEQCSNTYCEDHLPAEAELVGKCQRFEALGYTHPSQAYYIQCSSFCIELSVQRIAEDNNDNDDNNNNSNGDNVNDNKEGIVSDVRHLQSDVRHLQSDVRHLQSESSANNGFTLDVKSETGVSNNNNGYDNENGNKMAIMPEPSDDKKLGEALNKLESNGAECLKQK